MQISIYEKEIWWWWFVGIFILHFPIAAAAYQHLPPLLSTLQPALDDYQIILTFYLDKIYF